MSIISAVYLFGAFQGLILVMVLISKYKPEINSHTFLISFIALDIGFLIYQYAVFERYLEQYPHLIGTYLPFLFLIPPLFYLYVRFATTSGKWERSLWANFLPAILVLLVMFPYYLSPANEKLQRLFNDFHTRDIYPLRGELGIALLLSGAIYAGLAYKSSLKNKASNARWIHSFCIGFGVLVVCLAVSFHLMNAHFIPHRLTISSAIIVFSLFIHFIGFAALMEPGILSTSPTPKRVFTYGDENIRNQILQILVDEKKFTKVGFTLKELSQLMSTNENYLSRYINQEFGCNFPYLINSYRIEEAKLMINDPNYDHLNLLGIAAAVGFSNKNSFTRAFKRHTGHTPTSFREISR